jgi:hypothetical protein
MATTAAQTGSTDVAFYSAEEYVEFAQGDVSLAEDMSALVPSNPEAVRFYLDRAGVFAQLAVAQALRDANELAAEANRLTAIRDDPILRDRP